MPQDGFFDDPLRQQMFMKVFDAEKVGVYIQEQFSDFPGVAANAKLEYHKTTLDRMIAQISSWLVGGRIIDNSVPKIIKWPDSPWQMFKERHLPEWFKRKWPVRWHTEEFVIQTNHYFVCPHLVTDPQGQHVRFMATGTRLAREINTGRF